MIRGRFAPLMLALAGVLFFIIAFTTPASGRPLSVAFLALGVVFLILAFARYRSARAQPPVSTDPRLPARKTHQKHRQ